MAKQLIVPCIHSNGTSMDYLLEQVETAFDAVNDAITALAKTAPNGRDYYVYPPHPVTGRVAMIEAENQHLHRMMRLQDVLSELSALAQGIHDHDEMYVEVQE